MADPIVESLDMVSVLDPALDRERMDLERYIETRDMSLVQTLPGCHAVVFRVRPLTGSQFAHADAGSSAGLRLITAFMFGCFEIRNWPRPGLSTMPDHRIPNGRGGEMHVFGDQAIERVKSALSLAVIYEVGSVAYERAMLVGNEWGGGSMLYELPHSSREGLARIERHRAALIRNARATKTSAESPASSPASSEQTSDAASGATAVASPTAG